MKWMLKIWVVVALLGVSVAQVNAIEIFYPADKTYIRHANYLIVKGGAPQLEAMVLAFNGLRSAPINVGDANFRRVFKDLLIIPTPPFEKGQNDIVVEGYVGGKLVRNAHATIYYQPDHSQQPPEGYSAFVMHLPEKEEKCAGCHAMQVDEAQMSISDAADNPCLSCHKSMIKEKYVHGPVGSYSCGDCHILAASGQKYPVVKHGAALCNECHDDKTEEFKQNKYVHGPVAVGLCETCHDPHGSGHPQQLHDELNEVCLACHEQVRDAGHVTRGVTGGKHPLGAVKDPSRPGKEMTCASCHNPHGANSPRFLVGGAMSSFQLCGRCHQK